MYDKLILFCSYGAGDIHESREFAKEYMAKIPAHEYFYAHGKGEYILKDIENLGYIHGTEGMDDRKAWFIKDNDLYINMWIGRDSKYVLPGIGCVVEEFYRMHNDILKDMKLQPLEKDVYSYIPKFNFDKMYDFKPDLRPWVKQHILICNGPVHSNQAENFDFDPIIQKLVDRYPEIDFHVTAQSNVEKAWKLHALDLNNIAYYSQWCNIIIGRKSGPHVFSQHLDNWLDGSKTCLSFTYTRQAGHFVLSDHFPMTKEWSPATSTEEVFRKIVEVIEQ